LLYLFKYIVEILIVFLIDTRVLRPLVALNYLIQEQLPVFSLGRPHLSEYCPEHTLPIYRVLIDNLRLEHLLWEIRAHRLQLYLPFFEFETWVLSHTIFSLLLSQSLLLYFLVTVVIAPGMLLGVLLFHLILIFFTHGLPFLFEELLLLVLLGLSKFLNLRRNLACDI